MCLKGTKHYREGFLPNVEVKEKCGHGHKQTAIHFYWKIECSLNKRVNRRITRIGSRQAVDSVPLDCWDSAKAESLSLVITLFINPPHPNPQNKQQTSKAILSHGHSLSITKVPLVKKHSCLFLCFLTFYPLTRMKVNRTHK